MNLYLLDGAGALLLVIPLIFFIIVCVFGEAGIMTAMKFNSYGAAAGHSGIANIVSLIGGYALWELLDTIPEFEYRSNYLYVFTGLAFVLTVLLEALVLKLFNSTASWGRIFKVSLVMNLASYLLFILLFTKFII